MGSNPGYLLKSFLLYEKQLYWHLVEKENKENFAKFFCRFRNRENMWWAWPSWSWHRAPTWSQILNTVDKAPKSSWKKNSFKGGLISGSFFGSNCNFKKRWQITGLSTLHLKRTAQESDLAPFFGDRSQTEKLSKIKPPLPCTLLVVYVCFWFMC